MTKPKKKSGLVAIVTLDPETGEYSRGPLYDVLKKAFPNFVRKSGTRMLDLKAVAEKLGYTHEGICKPVRTNHCVPALAMLIVEKARGRVTIEEFYPFVFKK
jgi:hypothetical protein